eukprot:865709-Pyramimonas_sp.AAC.2
MAFAMPPHLWRLPSSPISPPLLLYPAPHYSCDDGRGRTGNNDDASDATQRGTGTSGTKKGAG